VVLLGRHLILPKCHAHYGSGNTVYREMVGGDAAYGSKANMRLVQDRDTVNTARYRGFVFAIARPWHTAVGYFPASACVVAP
jgi:hypothetical protein